MRIISGFLDAALNSYIPPKLDYRFALSYSPRREDVDDLRSQLARVEAQMGRELTAKQRRRLTHRSHRLQIRLSRAEDFATYDWEAGELQFRAWLGQWDPILKPGAFDYWRGQGVPARVLFEARREARQAEWSRPKEPDVFDHLRRLGSRLRCFLDTRRKGSPSP